MHNPALKERQITLDEYRQIVKDVLAPHRLELLNQQKNWIASTEKWIGKYLIRGEDVDILRIQPYLEQVKTDKQHEIWRYCRLWGSIPYNKGVGRRTRYLLSDAGQPNSPEMGVIMLCSPVVLNKPRAKWIGWEFPKDVDIKRETLLSCMDLTVSMAIPPYNHLTVGKLICLAALSNQVRQDYQSKFEEVKTPTGMLEGRLALVTTTSLYGSSVQYNRLRVDGRTAYQFVGYTAGFGNSHVTEEDFAEMEQYLRDVGKPELKGWGTGRSYRLRVITSFYRHKYGEDAPSHENPRSIYIAPLADNAQAFLQKKTDQLSSYDLPLPYLVESWRDRWLSTRVNKPEVMASFRSSDPHTMYLSNELS